MGVKQTEGQVQTSEEGVGSEGGEQCLQGSLPTSLQILTRHHQPVLLKNVKPRHRGMKFIKSHRRGKGRCAIRHQLLRPHTTLGDSAGCRL